MGRPDLERPSREDLIELVLRLQRRAKTSRTSSKPPPTDRKERRDASCSRRWKARA
jgi:transposase